LLLETAQALDESRGNVDLEGAPAGPSSPLAQVSQIEGVEFVLTMKPAEQGGNEARGLESPERMAAWSKQTMERFRALGERLQAGPVEQIEALGPQRNVVLAKQGDTDFCVGWKISMNADQIRETMKKVLALWAS